LTDRPAPGNLFANLILIRFLSLTGDSLIRYALPVYVFTQTGSAAYSGLAYALEWGPRILVLPFLGAMADRLPLRRQLLWLEGIRLCLLVVLARSVPLPAVIVIGSVFSVMNSYSYVLLEGCMSVLFGASRGGKVQARIQATDSVALIAGPGLAGILLTSYGFVAATVVGSLCLVASVCGIIIFRIPLRAASGVKRPLVSTADLREVVELLKKTPVLLRLMVFTAIINLVEGTIMALIPAVMLSSFGQTPLGVGVLNAAANGGAALALIGLSFVLKRTRLQTLAIWSGVAMVATGLALGVTGSVVVFCAAFVAFMIAQSIFVVHARTERLKHTPMEHIGKIVSVMNSFIMIPLPLSGLLVAALAGRFHPQTIVMLALAAGVALVPVALLLTGGRARLAAAER
jgi:MFS family permease